MYFFPLSLKFLFHDFERLQLKYLFFGIPAPFLLSSEFYFGISVLLLISGIPPLLVAFSPPRISPLVWSFPLSPDWIPNMEIVPSPRGSGNSKNNSLFSAINPNFRTIETETILWKTLSSSTLKPARRVRTSFAWKSIRVNKIKSLLYEK